MERSLRYYYLKFSSFIIFTIGLLLGFSAKIIAQYGVPMVNYFLKGKVYSQETQQPVSDILIDKNKNMYGQSPIKTPEFKSLMQLFDY